jgi:lysophospholipase L1-like esterase
MKYRTRYILAALCCCAGLAQAQDTPHGSASALLASTAPADTRWQASLAAFDAADQEHAPPPGGVLFVGSSSIRLWDGLEKQFSAQPVVIKRGFGGSRMSDCTHYLDRLVTRYQPRLVLVYAGDNDLAEGRTPIEVLQSFQAFADGVHRKLPATRIAFISIKPSPLRRELLPQIREANALINDYTRTQDTLEYIDVFTPMLDGDGAPRAELFRADALHMNDAGYALWKRVIAERLR